MSKPTKPSGANNKSLNKLKRYPLAVSDLQVGMFVCELDRPWKETPFKVQGFRVEDKQHITKISDYCETVYIEVTEQELLIYRKRQTNHRVVKI